MGEPALLPTETPVLTLVRFCERCQLKKKPGTAKPDLEKLNDAFRKTEEGRAELFQFYRLLLPEVLTVHFLYCSAVCSDMMSRPSVTRCLSQFAA